MCIRDSYERDFYAWTKTQAEALQRLAATRPEPRAGWMDEIDAARDTIADRLTETLRHDLEAELPALYIRARRAAAAKLARYDEAEAARTLPDTCPWTLARLLDMEWWPEELKWSTSGKP